MGKMEKSVKKITQLKWQEYQKPKYETMGRTKHVPISISVWSTNTYSSKIANTCAIRKKKSGKPVKWRKKYRFFIWNVHFFLFPFNQIFKNRTIFVLLVKRNEIKKKDPWPSWSNLTLIILYKVKNGHFKWKR